MEISRLRLLLLSALAVSLLPGCAWFGRNRDEAPPAPVASSASESEAAADKPVIEPQVERREVKRARIDTEDFEVGLYAGVLSIEDFESNAVYGAHLSYHLTEDFFVEGSVGRSRAGRTSYEKLSGSADLLRGSERDYTYYALSAGWNALPGEVFMGKNRSYNTAFYLLAGIGSTRFGGDDLFTVNAGAGYKVLLKDWMAMHLDVRDYIFDSDLLGKKKIVNNLEAHLGISFFF